jgi:hypothetical protein
VCPVSLLAEGGGCKRPNTLKAIRSAQKQNIFYFPKHIESEDLTH